MKKLFTSLLLLGAVMATQAQVTVTGYDASKSTVTINFTYDGARPTTDKVNDAINAAFGKLNNPGQQPEFISDGTYANLKPHQRKDIKTVILTGDWNNVDIDQKSYPGLGILGNGSIAKAVQEFSDNNNAVTLDLSQCEGFDSKFVSVRDYYGAESPRHKNQTIPEDGWSDGYYTDYLESDFTYTPTAQAGSSSTETFSKPVTVNTVSREVTLDGITVTYVDHQVTVDPNGKVYQWNNNGQLFNVDPTDPNSLPTWAQADCTFEEDTDGWYIIAWGNRTKLVEINVTVYKYLNENNQEITQYDTNGLRQDGDNNWWYTRYVYDQYGNHYVSTNAPDAMIEYNGGYLIPTTYSYTNENDELISQNNTNGLRQDGDNWYYDYYTYTYTDENNNTITTTNTTGLTENNGTYTYEYNVTTVVDPVCEFHISNTLNIDGIIFPLNQAKFDFIPDELFYQNSHIKKAELGNNIVAIGNHAFDECTNFEEVNFPLSLREMGHQAFKKSKITKALMAETQLSRIRLETFEECKLLVKATFPSTLIEIQKCAFDQAALDSVDLSQCHELRMLAGACFDQMKNWSTDSKPSLLDVKLCSHPKIIRGTSQENGGDSHGAFHEDTAIKRVEVVGCENTCVTECVCENRGFEWDITHYQTAAPVTVYDLVAELIYPNNLPACEGSGYTSSFDFFEGDYKAGTMITQETLLCYYRQIPNTGTGEGKFKWIDEQTGREREESRTVTADDRYIGNGWLEFVKTGSTTVVPKGEFLRTYSRTAGDGPCQLPKDITAYRAVDYKSNATGWVLDRNRKTGTHYLKADATNDLTDDNNYVLITPDTDPAVYADRPLYSKVTTGGKLYLRPLVAKVAQYTGITGGYTEENMEAFDSEEIYSQLQNVPGGYSYVPEETGVVLYSRSLLEEAFLVLGGDFGTETVYKKFRHTGDRYEEGRLTSSNTDDDINMLSGSFGTGVPVAPVFPWVYKDKTNYSGGHYTDNKEYRNFAVVKIEENGGSVIEDRYRWKRLTPSKMKENRAFAQIPVNRFDNWNESVDQMPDFTIDDEVEGSNSSNLMLISVFEDEELNGETDGIEEIRTAGTAVVKANDNAWYTIQGVRVAQPTKGVYIHNGKKVVID